MRRLRPSAATLRPYAQRCKLCGTENDAAPDRDLRELPRPARAAVSGESRRLPDRATIAARPQSMWRYREWLPFEGEPVASLDTGFTPLIDAPRLADKLGVARVWVKNDAVSHPTLSFKDRVVSTAINAALAFGLDTVGCASTGNLANAVAAHAARAGLASWIFIPEDLEIGKVIGTAVYGPNLVRIKGHYDDVNRLCAQLADRFGWGIVNVNLRGYYGEGSKTMAFEIAEQLGWRAPSAVVAPMAGGSLVTKLGKGFKEFIDAGLVDGATPRVYGTQASGCAPIVRLWRARRLDARAGDPEHDRALDRDRESGGWSVRREGDARVGRSRPARERRSARRRHPPARRDDGRVHGDGGRCDALPARSRSPKRGTSIPTMRLYCASRATV